MSAITAPKELLPIFAALATGEPVEIESRKKDFNGTLSEWKSAKVIEGFPWVLCLEPDKVEYRIKPKLTPVTFYVLLRRFPDNPHSHVILRSKHEYERMYKTDCVIIHEFTLELPDNCRESKV